MIDSFGTSMRCSYGERGSLTATCVNATTTFFRASTYRFDNLDETVICLNCTLDVIEANTFDIAGNLIKNLILTNSQITQLKQSSFIGLVFLEHLMLNDNKITEIVPLTFRGIKKLITLKLNSNLIVTIKGDSFKELIHLQSLTLNDNLIETIESGAFNGLAVLKELNLKKNKLHDVKDIFLPLIAIETINLEQNLIEHVYANDLNTTTLIELILSRNSMRNIFDNAFELLYNLRLLDLSWNAIGTLNEKAFNGLRNLTQLDLDNNLIETLPKTVFNRLHKLSYLHVSSNKIKEFSSGTFSGLPELRALNISSNKIKTIEASGVLRLHSLHTFDVSFNQLNDIDYKFLVYMIPKLSHLGVNGNKLPCYLNGEIRDFFKEDNIIVDIDDYDAKNCKLVNPSLEKNVTVDFATSIAKEFINDDVQKVHNGAMYTLFTILLLLICLLSFVQYRFYKTLNNFGINTIRNRTMSRAQLVNNSDYENNENGSV